MQSLCFCFKSGLDLMPSLFPVKILISLPAALITLLSFTLGLSLMPSLLEAVVKTKQLRTVARTEKKLSIITIAYVIDTL
jgi:hypothetical protein